MPDVVIRCAADGFGRTFWAQADASMRRTIIHNLARRAGWMVSLKNLCPKHAAEEVLRRRSEQNKRNAT